MSSSSGRGRGGGGDDNKNLSLSSSRRYHRTTTATEEQQRVGRKIVLAGGQGTQTRPYRIMEEEQQLQQLQMQHQQQQRQQLHQQQQQSQMQQQQQQSSYERYLAQRRVERSGSGRATASSNSSNSQRPNDNTTTRQQQIEHNNPAPTTTRLRASSFSSRISSSTSGDPHQHHPLVSSERRRSGGNNSNHHPTTSRQSQQQQQQPPGRLLAPSAKDTATSKQKASSVVASSRSSAAAQQQQHRRSGSSGHNHLTKMGLEEGGSDKAASTRELRAKRLLQSRRATGVSDDMQQSARRATGMSDDMQQQHQPQTRRATGISDEQSHQMLVAAAAMADDDRRTTSGAATRTAPPPHFQAHDAAVERYLQRHISRGGGGGDAPTRTRSHRNTRSSAAAVPASHQHHAAPSDNTGRPTSAPHDHPTTTTTSQQQQPKKHYDTDDTMNAPGWSTVKRTSTTGMTSMTVAATANHDAYATEQQPIAAAAAPSSSGSSKVDQYLAQRQAMKQRSTEFTRLGKKKTTTTGAPTTTEAAAMLASAKSTESEATLSISETPAVTVSFDDDEEEEEEDAPPSEVSTSTSDDDDDESEDHNDVEWNKSVEHHVDDDGGEDTKEWSLRVCIVSAVDFPNSVVPNQPFSPNLKVGLVKLQTSAENPQGETAAAGTTESVKRSCKELRSRIERDGLASIPNSRIRCTTSKVLSKRDNGAVEFHEEMRWDGVRRPQQVALAIELSSRAVMIPANIKESPPPQKTGPFQLPMPPHHSIGSNQTAQKSNVGGGAAGGETGGKLGSLFRKIRKNDSAEMEEANAAAAVAKLLVQGDEAKQSDNVIAGPAKPVTNNQNELRVKLRRRKRPRKKAKMTEELRLGAKVIPLSQLPLDKTIQENETARVEQWFELETNKNTLKTSLVGLSPTNSTATRNPSLLVEISFSALEALDDSEDDMDEPRGSELKFSYSKRASLKIRNQLKQESRPEDVKVEEPKLAPGIIDYICVVGARDIGDQKQDDGARGWVNSTPECCILEQFPPNDAFHAQNGRATVLPGKVEWFCFPEGCRLWRGLSPPNHDELNLKRFTASSPAQLSTATASFDASLGCTTSFSWFVIASNSDEYGSSVKKTYGAVIRFYVPAPPGVDPTQDDFAQTAMGLAADRRDRSERKGLWVPLGICLTSSLPIIGAMEVLLLRLCETLCPGELLPGKDSPPVFQNLHRELASLIVSYQKPIPGVVNCSLPFLDGERIHVSVPAPKGLPALPHGNAIASVCRLIGADGLNYLLAAFLTECKILLHSDDVANIGLVAEVMTSLLYPFQWALPYIPVLPSEMIEFIEAPLSFLLGVPSCNLDLIDPNVLEDIVVVDLDRDFSTSEYFEGRRAGPKTKTPVPLPAGVASNISKAVHRLLRAEEDAEASLAASRMIGAKFFPRMEQESLPEREFRLSVALEICSLIRGFEDCLVFSSAQPVFNVDKFMQVAPSIFEEQRATANAAGQHLPRQVISPRSRRFVSILVCCQHFHQFLEALETDSLAFFHVIMRSLNQKKAAKDTSLAGRLLSLDTNTTLSELSKSLQMLEDRIPTYRVRSYSDQRRAIFESPGESVQFPTQLLQPIVIEQSQTKGQESGVKSISLEYLIKMEKNPWRYQELFNIILPEEDGSGKSNAPIEEIDIRSAIGDRRYRAWKHSAAGFDADEMSIFTDDSQKGAPVLLDMDELLRSVHQIPVASSEVAGDQSEDFEAVAKNQEAVARCLESLKGSKAEKIGTPLGKKAGELVDEAEAALQFPSARRFLIEVLRQRGSHSSGIKADSSGKRMTLHAGGSKLDPSAFDVLARLVFAVLDACDDIDDFETAYSILKYTAGLYTTSKDNDSDVAVVYLTERIGLHSIYANLGVWERAMALHASKGKRTELAVDIYYEAVVATLYEMNGYGIPAEELARFASKMNEEHGWYNSERGQTLLVLAKRVCLRRNHDATVTPSTRASDLELMSPSKRRQSTIMMKSTPGKNKVRSHIGAMPEEAETPWTEVGWCHPAAQSSRRVGSTDPSKRQAAQNLLSRFEEGASVTAEDGGKYMKRSAITAMAYLGSSVVVTGGLDGGVFMARQVRTSSSQRNAQSQSPKCDVRGIHLDWGSSGSRYTVGTASTALDGEYGVGAVTCLAATHSNLGISSTQSRKDVIDEPLADEEILRAMEGRRIAAGTTCGDLRVWSVKDVFSAVFYACSGGDFTSISGEKSHSRGAGGATSSLVSKKKGTDFAAGSSLTRLKFSLRGRALSGHRGGVSCIDVHSNLYRPDSIVSGGADGLIKLWSLKTPGTGGGRRSSMIDATSGRNLNLARDTSKASRSGDALSILTGHGGRILCVRTAWHGDRLLSGGADRTVRLWDLSSGGGKCLNSLSGHFGWVTSVQYWGPNTIFSTSTDRSVAIWDARVQNSPLFVLRYHKAPVSDLLVGPRSEPVMVSAAVDGSVAAWDVRLMVGSHDLSTRKSKAIRNPTHTLYTDTGDRPRPTPGPVSLSKGVSPDRKTALCVGGGSIIREWDYQTGEMLNSHPSGHCDAVSAFVALGGDKIIDNQLENNSTETATATISSSWDGTVRMRRFKRDKETRIFEI